MKSRVVVTAFIEKDGKVLLGQKRKGVGPYPDTWHLPGGGVNLGDESIDDAIIREVKEETGLDVERVKRVIFDEDFEPDKTGAVTHYIFLVYKMTAKSFKAKAADDIVELQWFDKKEIKNLSLPRPLLKQLKEGLL